MDWSGFFTVASQVIVGCILGSLLAIVISGVARAIRKSWYE